MATQELEKPTGKRNNGHYTATEIDAQAIEALRLKILGTRDVDIAAALGVARATVTKRLQHAIATHGQATVAEHREIAKQRLEVALLALGPGVERGDYEAVGKWVAATAAYAKLVGAEAPVQAEVHVTVETEQEKQLKDLLAQAERDEKVRESEIVDAEVVESHG
jgi:predicted DNA-binding protein (UPF0251 family)